MTVNTTNSGTFTAKVQNQRDFDATRLSVFFDGEYWHFAGEEGNPTTPADPYRMIYIHVKKTPDGPVFHSLNYLLKEGLDTRKFFAGDGTFTINFDETSRRYRMSFHVQAKFVNETLDIMGSFDLRQS